MMIQHQIRQPFVQNMGVDFSCRDVGVTQQCLDHAEISTVGKQMRGKGMAQSMRRHLVCVDATSDRKFLYQHIKPVPCQVT